MSDKAKVIVAYLTGHVYVSTVGLSLMCAYLECPLYLIAKTSAFYLCLLHEVQWPKSFQDHENVSELVFTTYRETGLSRGMSEDYSQWDATMTDDIL